MPTPQGGACISDVLVNRNSREYGETDDQEALRLLEFVLNEVLLQRYRNAGQISSLS